MIKRNYHLAVRKNHGDGSMSYSFMSTTASSRSWFACPDKVLNETMQHCREQLKDKPGSGDLEIINFSRV